MKKRIILAVLTSGMIILMSLSIKAFKKWHRYVIEAGTVSSMTISEPLSDLDRLEFTFRTNPTWYYNHLETPVWNKIRGISNGEYRKYSSAYLTYQCVNDSLLVVGACCIVDGVGPQENNSQQIILDTIDANGEYTCKILREDGKYKFYFEDKYWDCPAGEEQEWGYIVNPHLDPDFTLDHDWMVDLLDLR